MKIREIFSGNLSTQGMVIQHQSLLIVGVILLILDSKMDINLYKEFTYIIKILAWMHFATISLRYISTIFENNSLTTSRIIINFICSMIQLSVIIVSIGLYVKSFAPKTNEDGSISKQSYLPLGVWHMVNIYQFWVMLEIIAFFTNFVAIIFTLFVSSFWHHKTKRTLTVPLALVQEMNKKGAANNNDQVPNN